MATQHNAIPVDGKVHCCRGTRHFFVSTATGHIHVATGGDGKETIILAVEFISTCYQQLPKQMEADLIRCLRNLAVALLAFVQRRARNK